MSWEALRRKLGDSGRLLRLGGSLTPPPGAAEGKMGGLFADVNVVGESTDPGDSGCKDLFGGGCVSRERRNGGKGVENYDVGLSS